MTLHPASDLERLFSEIETPRDGVVPLWCDIPAGSFLMGQADSSHDDEHPVHRVEIARGFRIACVPVTNAQYAALFDSDAEIAAPNHPKTRVDWEQSNEFCRRLAKRFDWARGAQLPTEEEWEYACRAGTTTRFWSGDDEEDLARVGWYKANSGGAAHAVGEKAANPWGLYDVHGNVWERTISVWDREGDKYARRRNGYSHDPQALDSADLDARGSWVLRTVRGGSHWNTAFWARAACRDRYLPSYGNDTLGFRVVLPFSTRNA